MFSYSPFISFRMSPLQKFKPDTDLGLRGWLCEQYRQETGVGEWKLYGFIAEPPKQSRYYEPQGTWAFVLNNEIRFSQPHTQILEHFNLTYETLSLLEETATATHPYFQSYHYLSKKEWGDAIAKSHTLYQDYQAACERLHQKRTTNHLAPEFGIARTSKNNPIETLTPELIDLCRHYFSLYEQVIQTSPFDDSAEDLEAQRDEKLGQLIFELDRQNIQRHAHSFAEDTVKWYGR